MPNYIPANLAKGQAQLLGAFRNNELRFRLPVTFQEFLRNTTIMFPDHQALRTREDRPIEAYYNLRTSRALGVGRSHNHTGIKGDSGVLTPSWVTNNDVFAISLKQGDNNVQTMQEMFNNELQNVIANFAEGYEVAAINYLFNNRTGVNTATSEGAFNGANDVFEITDATNGNRAIQITKGVMHINKYSGNLTIFCDTVSFNKFNFLANQGQANNQNLTFQFGGVSFVHSVEMDGLAAGLGYTQGFWVGATDGSYAALPWIPTQNRQGIDTKVNQYGTILNPVDGQTYAIHNYEQRADETATNGYTQDMRTEYEVSLDIAFESTPLSTPDETPLFAFGLI